MNHSTSFRAAGSAIPFRVAVASSVFALRARPMASFTSARSPVSGGAASLGGDASFDRFDFCCASACRACRCFPTAALRWGRASFASCVFLACCCLGFVRAAASVETKATAATASKQDSERKQRFIPWSSREPTVTNQKIARRVRPSQPRVARHRWINCRVGATVQEKRRGEWNPKVNGHRSGPTGKSPAQFGEGLSSRFCKNIPIFRTRKSPHKSRRPAPQEGRSRSSRTWSGMRWTQAALKTRALNLRTAKSCGPDTPTLVSSS